MTPHLPIEDPSERGSLVDRTVAHVRSSLLLRIVLIVTVFDHVAAILLVATGHLSGPMAGLLALLSVLTWFFGVLVPLMNREVRLRLGANSVGYWGEVVEMFARVVLCVQAGLYTALLLYAAL